MSTQQLWDQAWLESKGDTDLTNARVGGRATKANPNKEDQKFWQEAGPRWVEAYVAWRKAAAVLRLSRGIAAVPASVTTTLQLPWYPSR